MENSKTFRKHQKIAFKEQENALIQAYPSEASILALNSHFSLPDITKPPPPAPRLQPYQDSSNLLQDDPIDFFLMPRPPTPEHQTRKPLALIQIGQNGQSIRLEQVEDSVLSQSQEGNELQMSDCQSRDAEAPTAGIAIQENGRWKPEEHNLYMRVIRMNLPKKDLLRKLIESIPSRSDSQIRAHHQKMMKKFNSIQRIIQSEKCTPREFDDIANGLKRVLQRLMGVVGQRYETA